MVQREKLYRYLPKIIYEASFLSQKQFFKRYNPWLSQNTGFTTAFFTFTMSCGFTARW